MLSVISQKKGAFSAENAPFSLVFLWYNEVIKLTNPEGFCGEQAGMGVALRVFCLKLWDLFNTN